MMRYTIEHKYNGMIAHIQGFDKFDAFRKSNKSPKYWVVIDYEEL